MKTERIDLSGALTLSERVEIYEKFGIHDNDYGKFEEWISRRGLLSKENVLEFLQIKGLTTEQVVNSLKTLNDEEKKHVNDEMAHMKWVSDLYEAMEKYSGEYLSLLIGMEKKDLSVTIAPFINLISRELKILFDNLNTIVTSQESITSIVTYCSNDLINLIIKTIVGDFHNSDKKGEKENEMNSLQEYLEENFLSAKNYLRFFSKYPVCVRRLSERTNYLVAFISKVFNAIAKEKNKIRQIMDLQDDTFIIDNIKIGQGDTHEQGKSVAIITINANKIVYKPRRNDSEIVFFNELNQFFRREGLLDLYENEFILGEEYVFEKYVEYVDCKSEEEVKKYYRRIGQLGALLYLFRGNDVHYENIIAHGEYPVIVDMETLFQYGSDLLETQENATYKIYKKIMSSIDTTALLPFSFLKEGGKGIDISALGGQGGKLPYGVLQLVENTSNGIRFEKRGMSLPEQANIPKLKGVKVAYIKYASDILLGISSAFKAVYNNKDYFVGKGGTIQKFTGMKVRQLLRATNIYGKFMSFTSHPKYSTQMIDLERMLLNSWDYPFKNKKIILDEVDDMREGDIPIFYSYLGQNQIVSSKNKKYEILNCDEALKSVENRIIQLDEKEISRLVVQAKVLLGQYNPVYKRIPKISPHNALSEQNVINCAVDIGYEILNHAVLDKKTGTIDWGGVVFDSHEKLWKTAPIGIGYYYGSSGIMALFSFLSIVDQSFVVFADMICENIMRYPLEDIEDVSFSHGLYGILFAATEAYICLRKKNYHNLIIRLIKRLEKREYNDTIDDKTILAFMSLYLMVYGENDANDLKKEYKVLFETVFDYVLNKIDESFVLNMHIKNLVNLSTDEMMVVIKKYIRESVKEQIEEDNDSLYNGVCKILVERAFLEKNEDLTCIQKDIIERCYNQGLVIREVPYYSNVSINDGLAGIAYALMFSVYPRSGYLFL